jgi:hypothetical protein
MPGSPACLAVNLPYLTLVLRIRHSPTIDTSIDENIPAVNRFLDKTKLHRENWVLGEVDYSEYAMILKAGGLLMGGQSCTLIRGRSPETMNKARRRAGRD